jgi:hypothetical protein
MNISSFKNGDYQASIERFHFFQNITLKDLLKSISLILITTFIFLVFRLFPKLFVYSQIISYIVHIKSSRVKNITSKIVVVIFFVFFFIFLIKIPFYCDTALRNVLFPDYEIPIKLKKITDNRINFL